jgi:membrane protease YdiL (CAAX protease family)
MKYGIWFGLLSVVIISIAYYFLRESIDWQAIRTSANARGVNETTFLLAFAYIMFGNSLVEEYFFRGVIFRNALWISQIFAYLLSACMFSLYHITIFGTWFSGFILWLALFGLFIGGLFFAWLYKKTGGIWWAWIFHIFADLTILVIGYVEIFS